MSGVPPRVRDDIWRSIATHDWPLFMQVFKDAPDDETRRRYAAIRDHSRQTILNRLERERDNMAPEKAKAVEGAIGYIQELGMARLVSPSRAGQVLPFPDRDRIGKPKRKPNPFRVV